MSYIGTDDLFCLVSIIYRNSPAVMKIECTYLFGVSFYRIEAIFQLLTVSMYKESVTLVV